MSTRQAPAGWYPDTTMNGTQRYWDGSRWTQHVAPLTQPAGAPRKDVSDALVFAGFLLAILMPIIGFVLGVVVVAKDDNRWPWSGLAIVVVSIVAGLFWASRVM